jgi:hypothetical protein
MPEANEHYVTHDACERTSATLLEKQQELLVKLESIEKRLFKDNGSVSMQTRLDRHDQALRLLLWVTGVIGGTLLVGFAGGLAMLLREAVLRGAAA